MSTRWVRLVLVLLLTVLPGCDTILGPSEDGLPPRLSLEIAPLPLDRLEIVGINTHEESRLRNLMIRVAGGSDEPWRSDRSHLRDIASVVTSGGDAESMLIGPSVCPNPDVPNAQHPDRVCHEFFIYFDSPSVIPDIRERVEALPAAWRTPHFCLVNPDDDITCESSFADLWLTVELFGQDPGTVMREVIRWPGVKGIDPMYLVQFYSQGTGNLFTGGLPVAVGPADPGNGVLEVVGGDTVTVEYTRADGTVVRAWREVES